MKLLILLKQKLLSYKYGFVFAVLILTAYLVLFVIHFIYFENKQQTASADYFNSNTSIFGLNIPKNLNFAGEKVPQNDQDIKESLEKEFLENVLWKSHSELFLRRINRWFPIIEPILKKNGIPDDFKYIAIIESNLTNSISPQQAVGFWQLIEVTAINYDLVINDEIDERYDVIKSTEAACKYFKSAYKKFNNWTLAAASYNLGINGIEKRLKTQQTENYYDLLLNTETSRYIYRILAIKTVVQHPENFGFKAIQKVIVPKILTTTLKVDSTINDLNQFATNLGYNRHVLKIFNPWLRKNSLTNPDHKTYKLQLPHKKHLNTSFDELERELLADEFKRDKDTNKLDSKTDSLSITATNEEIKHHVEKGETIHTIAEKYGVLEENIRKWNNFDSKKEPEINSEIIIFPSELPAKEDVKKP